MIEACGLTKRFGTNELAIDNVDLIVRTGEVCCLLGANGAGKTTLIKLLTGLLHPTAGSVSIGGVDPTLDPIAGRRRFTLLSADATLFNTMTPWQNLQFLSSLSGPSCAIDRQSAENALRRIGVPERQLGRPIAQLSRHASVCVWLALAFVRNTPAVVLDEPTAGLDAGGQTDVHEALRSFCRDGKAVLIATADVFFASRAANRVCVLKRGRKVVERTSAQMLESSLSDLYFDYVDRAPSHSVALS